MTKTYLLPTLTLRKHVSWCQGSLSHTTALENLPENTNILKCAISQKGDATMKMAGITMAIFR